MTGNRILEQRLSLTQGRLAVTRFANILRGGRPERKQKAGVRRACPSNAEAACWTRRPEQKTRGPNARATPLSWSAARGTRSLRRRRRCKAARRTWQSEARHLQYKNSCEGTNSGGAEDKQNSPTGGRAQPRFGQQCRFRARPSCATTSFVQRLFPCTESHCIFN